MSSIDFARAFHKTPALVCYPVRCGKPPCRCAVGQGYGPYWFLHWREGAIQRRRYVRQANVDAVRAVIARRRHLDREARQAVELANLRDFLSAWPGVA